MVKVKVTLEIFIGVMATAEVVVEVTVTVAVIIAVITEGTEPNAATVTVAVEGHAS